MRDATLLSGPTTSAVARISAESDDLRWWPLAALPDESDTVSTMVALARARSAAVA